MITLSQTGRAGLEFLGSLQKHSSSKLRERGQKDVIAAGGAQLVARPIADADPDEVIDMMTSIARGSEALRFERFYQRFVAEEVYDRGIPAAEEKRAIAEPILATAVNPEKAGTLILNPDLEIPDYYDGVEWHLQPGGWDGFDLSMPMFAAGIAPLVFSQGGYAAVDVGVNIRGQRAEVIGELPRKDYKRFYEPGSGGVVTLMAIRQLYPEAELVGSDLSAAMQKSGYRMAGLLDLNVTLKQEDCCDTSEPDDYYDAVVVYALFHEMPDDICLKAMKEMYRIMEPGGDIVISDPPPLRAVSPFRGYLLNWEGKNREEPYFEEHIRRNLGELLTEAGFVDAEEYALSETGYPWVAKAHKPGVS